MRDYQSATSIGTFAKCEVQYMYSYLEGIKLPPRGAMFRGKEVGKGIEIDVGHVVDTGELMDAEQLLDIVDTHWEAHVDEVEDWQDSSPGETKDITLRMVDTYHHMVVPELRPINVEKEIWIRNERWALPILGYTDIQERDQWRDVKTTLKSKNPNELENDIQSSLYMMADDAPDEFIWDVLVGLKTGIKVQALEKTARLETHDRTVAYVARLQEGILLAEETGVFKPAQPDSWVCSPKWCGYWDMCPYGGGS